MLEPRKIPYAGTGTGASIDTSKQKARAALEKAQERDSKLTQVRLAEHLGRTTGAVSKILNNEGSHPMSMQFAIGLSEFLGMSLDEIFGTGSPYAAPRPNPQETDSLEAARLDEAPEALYEESRRAVQAFFAEQSIPIGRSDLNPLAEQVASEIAQIENPTPQTYQEIIIRVISARQARAFKART